MEDWKQDEALHSQQTMESDARPEQVTYLLRSANNPLQFLNLLSI